MLDRDELTAAYDRSAFTEERFRELARDSRFFQSKMGWGNPGWPQCFTDLGFNPAPTWTVIGSPVANLVPTSWPWFWLVTNSDLPFYLLAFGLVWWAFGLRMAAVMTLWLNCAQLNEARFTGGFLQYDWLVSCLSAIALYHKGWYRSAGVALSWGAMTRVFPGFLLLPVAIHVLRSVLGFGEDGPRVNSRWLEGGRLARIQRSHWNFGLAFTVACALLFGASTMTGRGLENWSEWATKIEKHSKTHPATSNMRIGVGRLALHQPASVEEEDGVEPSRRDAAYAAAGLWQRMTHQTHHNRFWKTIPKPPRRDPETKEKRSQNERRLLQIEASQGQKRLLQLLGLPLLLLALIRRKTLDGMILMLFGAFLMVTVSRYYASTWAMLFALGAVASSAPASKRLIPLPALFAGGALLFVNALYYQPLLYTEVSGVAARVQVNTTTMYYMLNYMMYGAFMLLCLGYLWSDVRALIRVRAERVEGIEPEKAPPVPSEHLGDPI